MNILIVSGFLGAGKTTFIKELIKRTGTNPVVLENEYGDNSIDAKELRGVDVAAGADPGAAGADAAGSGTDSGSAPKKLEILEFMEGCVCCTMKDSFVNSVLTIYSGLSPEYLIVEPTGVGKLSNIINNLKPILHGDVKLLNPIVVIAPRSYRQNMNEWEELYKDQVANASTVIFSKCENESPDMLAETTEAIRKINQNANIISTHYTQKSDEWWKSLLSITADDVETVESDGDSIEFSQLTLRSASLKNPGELVVLLEDCLHGNFGHIARAKGTIPVGGETLRFDLADNLYSISGSPIEDNECVFIGTHLDKLSICSRLNCLLEEKKVSLTKAYVGRKKS